MSADGDTAPARVGELMPVPAPKNLPNRGGGRPIGAKNKFPSDVKAMILEALHGAGGAEYLLARARDNPAACMTLIGKVLPLAVVGEVGVTINWPLNKPKIEP